MGGKSVARQQYEAERAAPAVSASHAVYRPVFALRATDYCLLGATNDELAGFFDVDVSTIQRWLVEIPGFKRGVAKGREVANIRVVRSLHAAAVGFTHKETKLNVVNGKLRKTEVTKTYAPNVNAAALILTNRDPTRWKDKSASAGPSTLNLAVLIEGLHGAGAKVIEGQAIVQKPPIEGDKEQE